MLLEVGVSSPLNRSSLNTSIAKWKGAQLIPELYVGSIPTTRTRGVADSEPLTIIKRISILISNKAMLDNDVWLEPLPMTNN